MNLPIKQVKLAIGLINDGYKLKSLTPQGQITLKKGRTQIRLAPNTKK